MDLRCSATTITSLSEVPLSDDCVLIFDLDDTLYAEREYVRSGFRAISHCFEPEKQTQVFQQLEALFDEGDADPLGTVSRQFGSCREKAEMLRIYREHSPDLKLAPAVQKMFTRLSEAGRRLGLLTDGRSITQRNKIEALGLDAWISEIVISEEFGSSKPDARNYQCFEQIFPDASYAYVGDNLTKDFVTPNQMGWVTVALLDRGENIHPQCFDRLAPSHCPQFFVHVLS